MEGETIQPTRIDKQEYEAFKRFVRDVHGKTRGHLSTEIENALREYRKGANGTDPLTRIEDDIATIKASLTEADGGSVAPPTPSDGHTHAHADDTTTDSDVQAKPSANAPRQEKVRYLIDLKYDRKGGSLLVDTIIEDVQSEFHFEERTAEKFIQPVINELGAKRHPNNRQMVVWGKIAEKFKESEGDE